MRAACPAAWLTSLARTVRLAVYTMARAGSAADLPACAEPADAEPAPAAFTAPGACAGAGAAMAPCAVEDELPAPAEQPAARTTIRPAAVVIQAADRGRTRARPGRMAICRFIGAFMPLRRGARNPGSVRQITASHRPHPDSEGVPGRSVDQAPIGQNPRSQTRPLDQTPASRSVSVMPGPWPSRMNHSVPNACRNASSGMDRKYDCSLIWLACARMARRLWSTCGETSTAAVITDSGLPKSGRPATSGSSYPA